MKYPDDVFVHETANVSPHAKLGRGTKVWINVQIRENVSLGDECTISKDVYIDEGVMIGNRCKIQNSVSVYKGVTICEDVFVGPNVSFTNDLVPRSFNTNWSITPTLVQTGVSIGANATIVCGVTLGEYSMVAAGSVVTRDVPPYSLVKGNPARVSGKINKMGERTERN